MRILVTNDDGHDAPGLDVLVEAARQFGDPVVVAPCQEQSFMGHRVTTRDPLSVEEYAPQRFRVNGTPADCVRVALRALSLDIGWVFSGVNRGGNLGADLYSSGTVAAAREAAYLGVPAAALSQYVGRVRELDWRHTLAMTQRALRQVMAQPCPAGSFWNINFPHPAPEADLGLLALVECRPDANPQDVRFERSATGFVYCGRYQERPRSEARDVDLCFGGAITLSRLTVEHA